MDLCSTKLFSGSPHGCWLSPFDILFSREHQRRRTNWQYIRISGVFSSHQFVAWWLDESVLTLRWYECWTAWQTCSSSPSVLSEDSPGSSRTESLQVFSRGLQLSTGHSVYVTVQPENKDDFPWFITYQHDELPHFYNTGRQCYLYTLNSLKQQEESCGPLTSEYKCICCQLSSRIK